MVERIRDTSEIQGSIGELLFKRHSWEKGYYYIKLEKIYHSFTPNNKLIFEKKYLRKEITLPPDVAEEVRKVCIPSNHSEDSPSYVFDFLTIGSISIENAERTNTPLRKEDFHWVEVKTGHSELSANQKEWANKVTIPFIEVKINAEFPKEYSFQFLRRVNPDPKELQKIQDELRNEKLRKIAESITQLV